jgi:hypothetical protein
LCNCCIGDKKYRVNLMWDPCGKTYQLVKLIYVPWFLFNNYIIITQGIMPLYIKSSFSFDEYGILWEKAGCTMHELFVQWIFFYGPTYSRTVWKNVKTLSFWFLFYIYIYIYISVCVFLITRSNCQVTS